MIDRLGMVLVSLVSNGPSHRAVAETVLDIRTEHDEIRGVWTRMQWAVRSTVAIVRVVLRVLPRELAGLAVGGFGVRLGVWALVLVLPLVVPTAMRWLGSDARFEGSTRLILFATLLPQGLVLVLPVAAFLAALWPSSRSPSSVAMQGVAAAAVVLAMAFLVPAGNQVFRETAYAASLGTTPRAGVLARGLRELPAKELIGRALSGAGRNAADARRHALTMTGLVVAAGTFTLLGGLLARRARPDAERRAQRRWPYALGVPGLASVSMMFLSGVGLWASSLIAFTLAIRLATRRP